MAKKGRGGRKKTEKSLQQAGPLCYGPFKDLDKKLQVSQALKSRAQLGTYKGASRVESDDLEIFEKEMKNVSPLPEEERYKRRYIPSLKPPRRFRQEEEMEALAQLVDLTTGYGPFDCTFSDEYVEGCVAGLNPAILARLKGGEFSYQDFIDLHGLNKVEAREKVAQFLQASVHKGFRCVLIVHGRGLHSKGKRPVLKESILSWLCRGQIGKLVLAFSSAQPYDGGTGAIYVLLRRRT